MHEGSEVTRLESGRILRWQDQRGGVVAMWHIGKGGRVVRWQGEKVGE